MGLSVHSYLRCTAYESNLFCALLLFSSVACLAVQCFATLSYNPHDFQGKNVMERKMCVLIFSTTLIKKVSHSKKN